MDISNVIFIYIGIVVVLTYFIEKGRIEAIKGGNPAL
jgi:hypothetical protein